MTQSTYYKSKSTPATLLIFASLSLVGVLAFYFKDFLIDFYMGPRSTLVGQVFNSFILIVFIVGTFRILYLILSLKDEEKSVINLFENLGKESNSPFHNVSSESIIGKRYHIMETLYQRRMSVDHQSLAGLLESELMSRVSFPKFISGILVLLGMLGTILSLAIALVGASDILANVDNIHELGSILDGMSTALSTTMTGIVTYILYRFYLGKLLDVQNNLFYAIERVTTLTLVPQFSLSEDTLVPKLVGLVESLDKVVGDIARHHKSLIETNDKISESLAHYSENVTGLAQGIHQINDNLHKGFRL